LMAHLRQHGCAVAREGAKHTFVWHTVSRRTSAVPRHREIKDVLARKICRDLGIPVAC
jgi:mRNA interferase HicA